ncbi:MAG: cysteine methyltransferase [Candidatus Riflebacteria bacterium HGW-Riflebacteria-1]|jgi:methylated-DNA-[protein]-cysteine S-methyltransferase|nr:MAG: cysteine methyltransferase [Candidatus Riflebacteria bacterium HGW-Riflebacteria-1]
MPTTKKHPKKAINSAKSYSIFATALGPAAIAWRNGQIIGLLLPEASSASLRKKIAQCFGDCDLAPASTPTIARLIEQIQGYFAGKPVDFKKARLDVSDCTPFCQTVYEHLRKVPAGAIISYKALAEACERPNAARAIGLAAGKNPIPLLIPCHRVVNADGRLGGFSAGGGTSLKAQMLRLEDIEVEEKPALRIKPALLISDCDIDQVLKQLSQADANMGSLIETAPRFNLEFNANTSIFQALLESIVYQQLTGKAAATIFRRVLELFSGKHEVTPLDIIRAGASELRSAGLSQNKVLAIKDLAQFAISGNLPEHAQMRLLSNSEIISRLTHIRGIGRWTVEMLLIFKLGRADVMAADDYGLRKGLAAIRGQKELPTPAELARQGLAWKPYRSIASWYLWRAAENYKIV